tara:strand:- start:541 stop:669 length:129 start_codon:yes stop_codon:yes gene_type:complete
MVITKEHQEAMVNKYFENHTASETDAFSEGMEAMFNLIKKNL